MHLLRQTAATVASIGLVAACSSTTEAKKAASLSGSQVAVLLDQTVGSAVTALSSLPVAGAGRAGAAPRAARGGVSYQVAGTFACEQGGQIAVGGVVAGSLDDATGNGSLTVDAAETFDSCHLTILGTEMIIGGSLLVSGNYQFTGGAPDGAQSGLLRGDLDIAAVPRGSGSCSVNVTFNYRTDTQARTAVAGTACGYTVNF